MKKIIAYFAITMGIVLTAVNLYGLTQSLRPEGLTPAVLRFGEKDVTISHDELKQAILRKESESDKEYATRLTYAIAEGMAHIEWLDYHPDTFHQRVPIWENYILYFMGIFTTIPEYERYHFSDPYRSIERGIGICGDKSMTISGLLDEQGISNQIVTVPGHVMVQANLGSESLLLDGDFGVVLPNGIAYYKNYPDELIDEFQRQLNRVNDGELMIAWGLKKIGYNLWDGTSHFITKKYYFEKFAYFSKWLLPIVLIILSFNFLRRNR